MGNKKSSTEEQIGRWTTRLLGANKAFRTDYLEADARETAEFIVGFLEDELLFE